MARDKRILIVEDEADVAAYMAAALEDHGYDVSIASDAADGLARIRAENPDLVCLDVIMPGPSGLELYREIRGNLPLADLAVIVVSGLSERDAKTKLGLGEDVPPPEAFVEKPLDTFELLEAVDRVLARGGAADE